MRFNILPAVISGGTFILHLQGDRLALKTFVPMYQPSQEAILKQIIL
jgi:hypothetical protein